MRPDPGDSSSSNQSAIDKFLGDLSKGTKKKSSSRKSQPLVRIGSRGAAVKTLQRRLGIRADGIFGNDTLRAVKSYQRKKGISADGVVGKRTW